MGLRLPKWVPGCQNGSNFVKIGKNGKFSKKMTEFKWKMSKISNSSKILRKCQKWQKVLKSNLGVKYGTKVSNMSNKWQNVIKYPKCLKCDKMS